MVTTLAHVFARCCDGKRVHDTKEAAAQAALDMQQKCREAFNAYHCICCGKYHVGHAKNRDETTARQNHRNCRGVHR